MGLDKAEGLGVDGLDAEGIGHQPVRPGGDLGDQIRVARRVHAGGSVREHIEIHHHRHRCGAGDGLLVSAFGDGCAEGSISIHRGGRADHHVGAATLVRGQLGQVVDRARAHGNGNRLVPGEELLENLDLVVVRMQFVLFENEGVEHLAPGGLQDFANPPACRRKCVLIRNHHHGLAGEKGIQALGNGGEHPAAKFDHLGGRPVPEDGVDALLALFFDSGSVHYSPSFFFWKSCTALKLTSG